MFQRSNEIANVFSSYGILKDMLPTSMGGSIQLNQSEWIAKRQVIDIEEL